MRTHPVLFFLFLEELLKKILDEYIFEIISVGISEGVLGDISDAGTISKKMFVGIYSGIFEGFF